MNEVNKFWSTAFYLDQLLENKDIAYCFIKTYGGNESYYDNNIDVVVDQDLYDIYDKLLNDMFYVSKKDNLKSFLYETNKLMCHSKSGRFVSIHLHKNVGWHDHCFISKEEVLNNISPVKIEGHTINILSDELEREVLFLHSYFEKFKFSSLDLSFIGEEYIRKRIKDLNIEKPSIHEGYIELNFLRKIWWSYYWNFNRPNLKSVFFHLALLIKNYKFVRY